MVRVATLHDTAQILALQNSVSEAPQWNAAIYREFIELSSGSLQKKTLLVADEAGYLQGYAAATTLGPDAELESIVVAADSRRQGLGCALLEAVMHWASAEGAEALRLEVRAANVAALRFYERVGFQQVGLRRNYYRHPDDDGVLLLLKPKHTETSSP